MKNCDWPDWTQEEDEKLIAMRRSGVKLKDIAVELGRTYCACRDRSKRPGIRRLIVGEQVVNIPTPIEVEILQSWVYGLTDKEIARQRGICLRTVKNKTTMLYERLGVNNRTRAVTMAVRRGWVENDREVVSNREDYGYWDREDVA